MNDFTTTNPSELGIPVKEYKLSPARIRQLILLIFLSAGMATVCWVPAIFELNESLTTRVGISILGLFVALPMFVGIYQLFRLGGVSLSLFENGFIYRRHGREFKTSWDEIDSFIQESACRITKKDGEVIEFGLAIEGVDEIVEEIREQTLQRMLPQTRKAILDGSSILFRGLHPFGKWSPGRVLNNFAFASSGYTVDSQGITDLDGKNRIAWKDVKSYGIRQEKMGRMPVDVFVIQAEKDCFQTRSGLLSNAHVLLVLCAEMTGLDPMDRR